MKTFVIRFYLTEVAYRAGTAAFVETLKCDRNYAISWAKSRLKSSNFKFYDIQEK